MNPEYIDEIGALMKTIMTEMQSVPREDPNSIDEEHGGIAELDLVHRVIPESIGKEGKELEPYLTKFHDAMYMIIKAGELSGEKGNPVLKRYDEMWKKNHGYLEGR